MTAVEQKVQDLAVHVGLNNIIARDTSPTVNNRNAVGLNSGVSGRHTPTERPRYQLWPSFKRTATASGRRTPDLSDLKLNPFKEGTLHRRRKISVPELGPMTTVQEKHMDSRKHDRTVQESFSANPLIATIPGKFPVHERSNSAPGASWARSTVESPTLAPVGEPANSSHESFGRMLAPSLMEDDGHKSIKRASSLLLPDAITAYPFTADAKEFSEDDVAVKRTSSRKQKQEERPAVPPKSPRLTLRIPPTHTPMPNHPSSSSNSSTTTLAFGPLSTPAHNDSTDSFIFPLQNNNEEQHPAPLNPTAPSTPWTFPAKARASPSHSRNQSAGVIPTHTPTHSRERKSSMSLNIQWDNRQESIMNRGRPPKKNVPAESWHKLQGTKETLEDPFLTLPAGIPAHSASQSLPQNEIDRLRSQAVEQAERFEVLKYVEVRSLSRELRALDKRCEYLRETHNSLRSGRRSLHTRMISYLKSPRVSKFSREGILKQEEALSELDQSIDEWVHKLEQAENRRTRIRQKLLEHMAGALILSNPYTGGNVFGEDQTPPRSPVKIDSPPSVNRRDVESIKIYAGAELHQLFANIEKEMERMVNPNSAVSPTVEGVA
ncbi:hypothetical protein FQN50_002844 [Emmonsiellopsis sp. PD_5]|nr:hypothetical protein FQN50_002844 [Emmonsiellopsis sp. PD_5]